MHVELRKSTTSAEDQSFLLRLFLGLEMNAPLLHLGQDLLMQQWQAREDHYRERYPEAQFMLVLVDDQLAGRMVVDRSEDVWTLVDIALLSEFRSRGVGSYLIENLKMEADEANATIVASVMSTNRRAQAFWIQHGFQVESDGEVYWSLRYEP